MSGPLLQITGLGQTFDEGLPVLDDVSITLGRGEFYTLLGPSGCGKSTILRLVADLVPVQTGAIDWASGSVPEIGFVFQDATLMPWASALKNVILPLTLSGIAHAEATDRGRAALASVGLEDRMDAYPKELSGGMRMRVSIARALVTNPALLLMDEPFAALDEMTRFRLNDLLLERVGDLGAAVLFVTHSVFEAAYLSDRVGVLSSGPGTIVKEVDVSYEAPRSAELRGTERFAATASHLSDCLRRTGKATAA